MIDQFSEYSRATNNKLCKCALCVFNHQKYKNETNCCSSTNSGGDQTETPATGEAQEQGNAAEAGEGEVPDDQPQEDEYNNETAGNLEVSQCTNEPLRVLDITHLQGVKCWVCIGLVVHKLLVQCICLFKHCSRSTHLSFSPAICTELFSVIS